MAYGTNTSGNAGQVAIDRFAEMMIARMEQMKASDWKKGWIGGASGFAGLPQNVGGRNYSGYHNMVIFCPGAISSDFHCDKLKGNEDLTFNLFDDELFTSLSYKSKSGKIVSANEDYDRQINQLLNLNNRWLMANRLQALLGVIDYLNRKGWTASNLNQQISKWSNMDAEGRYKEYNSIVVWYLKKKQRQCDL